MGPRRVSTSEVELLVIVFIGSVVIAIAMPVYVEFRDFYLARGVRLIW